MSTTRYLLLALLLAGSSTGCKKWLDVTPKTEMPEDKIFSTQNGFQDALSGVYIKLDDDGYYGSNLSYGSIEYLASSWDVTRNSPQEKISRFDYADGNVETLLEMIYSKAYNSIININSILANIDERRSVFTTNGMYEMIKGECLALRAFCHFDMLRLFGPVPGNIPAGPILPYVKKIDRTPNPHISYEEFKAAVLADLAEAEKLLKEVDPIQKYTLAQLEDPSREYSVFRPDDPYQAFRQFRMNYYAIKALQARVQLWFGNRQEAFNAAKIVVDAKNEDGAPKFRLGVDADFNRKDYVLSWEHIWSLYDFKLYDKFTNNFGNGNLKKGSSSTIVNRDLYGNTNTDIRETKLWMQVNNGNGSKCWVIRKYLGPEKPESITEDLKRIPMLRISEMYLIMAECGTGADAQNAWNAYRTARNIPANPLPADPELVKLLVIKEYRKEFFAEGQAFFNYKRINATSAQFLWAPAGYTINYLPPVPKREFVQ